MMDTLIKNAKTIDGSGEPAYIGNVGIVNGKLVIDPKETEAAEVIDPQNDRPDRRFSSRKEQGLYS